MALREVCCWGYVGVERKILEVSVFIGSISLVADGL